MRYRIPTIRMISVLSRFLVTGPTPAETSGLRPISPAGLDSSDALLLWLDNFPHSAVAVVATTLVPAAPSSRGVLPAPPLSSFTSPLEPLISLPVGLRLLTWPGAAVASCPSSAQSMPFCERVQLSSLPRLILAPQFSEVCQHHSSWIEAPS